MEARFEMGFKIKLPGEENSIRKEALRPTADFMALVKDGLLGKGWLRYKFAIFLFDPKPLVALQPRTETAFGKGRCFHDFNLHGW